MSLIDGISGMLENEEAMMLAEESLNEAAEYESDSDELIDAMVDGYDPEEDPTTGLDPDLNEDDDDMNFEKDIIGGDVDDEDDDEDNVADDIDINAEVALIEDSIRSEAADDEDDVDDEE